jgi:hypothetical protein
LFSLSLYLFISSSSYCRLFHYMRMVLREANGRLGSLQSLMILSPLPTTRRCLFRPTTAIRSIFGTWHR